MVLDLTNPPTWLKDMPRPAVRIAVEVFNALAAVGRDEEQARQAAMSAVALSFVKLADGTWEARTATGTDRQQTIGFRAAKKLDEKGLVWEAVLIAPGLSLGHPRFYWSDELLEASVGVFAGVDINAYELTADFFTHLPIPDVGLLEDVKRYLTAKKVGWVEKTWWEPGVGIKAIINFLPEQAEIPRILNQGMERGNNEVLGLSIDTRIQGMEVVVDEWTVIWVNKVISCSSVDVVTHPAAGGKFIRAVAGLQTKEEKMDREKLLTMIGELRPDLLKGKDQAALKDDEVLDLARMAMTPEKKDPEKKDPQEKDPDNGGQRAAQGITSEEMAKAIGEATKSLEQRAACGRLLDKTLEDSDLPAPARQRIQTHFADKIFTPEELTAEMKGEKDYLASMSVHGLMEVGDQTRFTGGLGTRDKIEMAVDQLFELTADDYKELGELKRLDGQPFFDNMRAAQDYKDIPALSGLNELYVLLTGDSEVRGVFDPQGLPADLRAAQAITNSTFSYVVGNTMGRRLVKDYKAVNFAEDRLISITKPVKDFRAQEAVLIGYFGDLATVDPESADYQEIAAVTDEESTYTIAQKGNLLTITRKMILNDDLSVIKRLVSRLGRAARRTHAKYVWANTSSSLSAA